MRMLQKWIEMVHMLQWLYTYVASFYSQCFICVFWTHVAIMFTWMLHVFYSDVAYRCNGFQVCFRFVFQVFYKHVSSVSTAFRRMLQPLYLDISKVDRELHLSSSHLLLHRLSRSRQGIHTNEEWAMGAGQGSCLRWTQARELCTDGRYLRSEMGAGRRGLRTSRFGRTGAGAW